MTTNRAFIALDVALVAFCVYDALRRREWEKRRLRRYEESRGGSEGAVKSSASKEDIGQPLSDSSQELSFASCSTSTLAGVQQHTPTGRLTVDNSSFTLQREGDVQDVSVEYTTADEWQRFIGTAEVSNSSFPSSYHGSLMSEVDLSTLPPLPPSPLLPTSISYEHLEEQPGSELHLSTLPPLSASPPLSPSPSFEHFAHVDFKLPLDNSALEKQVIVDLTDKVKQDEIDIKYNVEDVSNGCPTEQEPSPLVEHQKTPPWDFEEGHTLVQDENASEAKNDAAVQVEVVGFLETVALVPSASLIELERPTKSKTKIPSSSSSPSMLGLYLSKPELATSVATSSAKESEEITTLLNQPEETKKTPAPPYKRTRRGGKNQRRPRKAYTSNGSASSPALNTKVPTTVAKASSSQASSSGSRKSESKGLGSKVSNRPSPHPAPALAARPSAHSSLPLKPKAARPIPKSTPSNGPPGTLSGGVKLGIPNETMNSQEKKTSGHGRGYRRSRKPHPRPSS